MEQNIDILWVMVSSGLVFFMQAGFLALEAGLTRSKNNINVAIKNITDFAISALIFWAFGFAFMFGSSSGGLIGKSDFVLNFDITRAELIVFLLFQIMFCGTSVTILSGAVAERIRFSGYMLIAVLISAVVYPIFGHWAWNGINDGAATGWLGEMGFVDFAGSTVVHSIGGWAALAILVVIGARSGRFSADGTARKIPASNMPLATLGVLILWMGWFGFNGGSTLAFNEQTVRVIINTILAGSAGLLSTVLVSQLIRGRAEVDFVLNGALAGLVSVTANAHAVSLGAAILIGVIGGLVMMMVTVILEQRRIDDAVGAIPVHLGAGAWGTLAVGIFGSTDILGTDLARGEQIGVQIVGIGVAGLWAFGITYLIVRIIDSNFHLRVSAEDEHIGLNVSEHGARTELLDLFEVMDEQAQTGDLSLRVPVEPFTEVGQIADRYNQVISALETATNNAEVIVRTSFDGIITFAKGSLEIISINPTASLMFGYSPQQLIGQPLSAILKSVDQGGLLPSIEHLDAIFERTIMAQQRPQIEMVGLRATGAAFDMDVFLAEAGAGDDKIYIGTFRDVAV